MKGKKPQGVSAIQLNVEPRRYDDYDSGLSNLGEGGSMNKALGCEELPMVVTLAGARKLSSRISLLNSFGSLEDFFGHALGKSRIVKRKIKYDSSLPNMVDYCDSTR